MNALVDDLFTFPLGSADGDGGDTKVHLITGGQTWSLGNAFLLDSSFGVSLFDQFCSSPDFGLGNLVSNSAFPAPTIRDEAILATPACPEFRTGFTALGNYANLEPGLPRREDGLFQHQRDQGRRQP